MTALVGAVPAPAVMDHPAPVVAAPWVVAGPVADLAVPAAKAVSVARVPRVQAGPVGRAGMTDAKVATGRRNVARRRRRCPS